MNRIKIASRDDLGKFNLAHAVMLKVSQPSTSTLLMVVNLPVCEVYFSDERAWNNAYARVPITFHNVANLQSMTIDSRDPVSLDHWENQDIMSGDIEEHAAAIVCFEYVLKFQFSKLTLP